MGATPNPYDPGNAVKPQYFAGREEQLREIRGCFESCAAGHPTHVFVRGEWGIGKTSLLLRLHPELEEHGMVIRESLPVGSAQGTQFYAAVCAALWAKVPGVVSPEHLDALTQGFQSPHGIREGLQTMMAALQSGGRSPIVVMLDEIERAQTPFLSDLRDIFQRLGQDGIRHMLLFAGRELPAATTDAADPVRRFFQHIPLERMTELESLEAIRRPIQFLPGFAIEEEAGRLIFRRTVGHPYFLKKLCHEIFDISDGRGRIDARWLGKHWTRIEERLARDKFQSEVAGIPSGERSVLLHASLLDSPFQTIELRTLLQKAPDVALLRLVERGLVRRASRGSYEIYHPLFRGYLQSLARQEGVMVEARRNFVPERRPLLGLQELERILEDAAEKWLDILDQHFRGRAVSLLEAVRADVQIRILMGQDKQWPQTKRYLQALDGRLRSRIEVRACVESQERPVPFHVRWILGDRNCWEISHSLDGVGRKATSFTNKSGERRQLRAEFNRWWRESLTIFPERPGPKA